MGISKTQQKKKDALAKREARNGRKQEILAENEQKRIAYERQRKLKNQADPLKVAEQDIIIDWLVDNEIAHPEYEQKVGELHAIEAKIRRLSEPWKCDRGGIEMFNTSSIRR